MHTSLSLSVSFSHSLSLSLCLFLSLSLCCSCSPSSLSQVSSCEPSWSWWREQGVSLPLPCTGHRDHHQGRGESKVQILHPQQAEGREKGHGWDDIHVWYANVYVVLSQLPEKNWILHLSTVGCTASFQMIITQRIQFQIWVWVI